MTIPAVFSKHQVTRMLAGRLLGSMKIAKKRWTPYLATASRTT